MVALAFLWGWAEATWFFVVPDVWLSFTVLWGYRTCLVSVLAALAGALVGAIHFYLLDPSAREALLHWWQICPGYAEAMQAAVSQHLLQGPQGLAYGPWLGIPYRLYLYQSHAQGLALSAVLWHTLWARIPRLILAPLVTAPISALLSGQAQSLGLEASGKRLLATLFALAWVGIYFDYWFVYVPETYP